VSGTPPTTPAPTLFVFPQKGSVMAAAAVAGGAGAGAGAGAAAASARSDSSILQRLRDEFVAFEASKKMKARLHLVFQTANGKTYRTTFDVEKDIPEINVSYRGTSLSNGCIKIEIPMASKSRISSVIGANTETVACFEPRLTSNSRNAPESTRTTTTDVLQVLKLKLLLAHPFTRAGNISLVDGAAIGRVHMTPFRLLRGGRPFYEKYGYVNPQIRAIMATLGSMSFGDVETRVQAEVDEYKMGREEMSFSNIFKERILSKPELANRTTFSPKKMYTKRELSKVIADILFDDPLLKVFSLSQDFAQLKSRLSKKMGISEAALGTMSIFDALKGVSVEMEEADYPGFSRRLMSFLFPDAFNSIYTMDYIFYPRSKEWAKQSQRLTILSATLEDGPTGSRGSSSRSGTKTRRKRTSKST
jgi:hypothetical protein